MSETADLAGIRGVLDQAIDPEALPESFEWKTDTDLTERELDAAEQKLRARVDDAKGSPLAFPNRTDARDVLVDIATVWRQDGDLLAVLRERSGTAARTADD